MNGQLHPSQIFFLGYFSSVYLLRCGEQSFFKVIFFGKEQYESSSLLST